MFINRVFDNPIVGEIGVRRQAGAQYLEIADNLISLSPSQANVASAFIDLGVSRERSSLKRMTEILGLEEGLFKVALVGLRKKSSQFQISGDVMADALFLSDRQREKTSTEKKPYHYNRDLSDLIVKHGLRFDPKLLDCVRTEAFVVVRVEQPKPVARKPTSLAQRKRFGKLF